MWLFTKIGLVCYLRILIPIAGKDALPACAFECKAESTYTTEQVNKPEVASSGRAVTAVAVMWCILLQGQSSLLFRRTILCSFLVRHRSMSLGENLVFCEILG